ncbi:MAG: hypothetical protein ACRYF1_18030 [Janthinobacterium lividum]
MKADHLHVSDALAYAGSQTEMTGPNFLHHGFFDDQLLGRAGGIKPT